MFCTALIMMALQIFMEIITFVNDLAMFAGGVHMQVSSLL